MIRRASFLAGIDISNEAIDEAKKRYGKHAEFHVSSMDKIKFPDGSFDTVICLEGIEHVSEELGDCFIREAKRILSPSGTLIISSPYTQDGKHSGNPHHIKEYNPQELANKVEKHFSIIEKREKRNGVVTICILRCVKD